MNNKKLPITCAAALMLSAVLAGCTPNDTTFGGAVRHNIALQTIDPDPVARTDAVEGGSGQRSAAAVKRYNEGTVKQPTIVSTTVGATGANGGGRSGSTSGTGPN